MFIAFHKRYHPYFKLKAKSVSRQSLHYLCGLMQADKKYMDRMIEVVPDSEWQSLQNFLSHSPWSERGLLDQLARDANDHIGGDAFYGDDPEFLRQLDQIGETFMLDIHKDQPVYLNDPTPYIPE